MGQQVTGLGMRGSTSGITDQHLEEADRETKQRWRTALCLLDDDDGTQYRLPANPFTRPSTNSSLVMADGLTGLHQILNPRPSLSRSLRPLAFLFFCPSLSLPPSASQLSLHHFNLLLLDLASSSSSLPDSPLLSPVTQRLNDPGRLPRAALPPSSSRTLCSARPRSQFADRQPRGLFRGPGRTTLALILLVTKRAIHPQTPVSCPPDLT